MDLQAWQTLQHFTAVLLLALTVLAAALVLGAALGMAASQDDLYGDQ